MVENLILLQKILLSLAIGALVGIERERRGSGELVEGFRTFMLISLLGTLTGFLTDLLKNQLPILLSFFAVAILTFLGYRSKLRSKHAGLTTEIAFLLTFIIGIIVYFESYLLAITFGVILTLVLFLKESLHGFAKHLTKEELLDAIIFAIVAVIILPQLPDRFIDPFKSINPYTIWRSVVIILGLSFASYIMMKIFGARLGFALTGFFGGLASSTGVTVAMTEKARASKKFSNSASFATLVASSTMFLRLIFLISVINFSIALSLLTPLLVLGLSGYVSSYFIWQKTKKDKTSFSIGSPLALKSAVLFAIFFTLVSFLARISETNFGETGLYSVSLIAGMVDVDAISISLASLAGINSANSITVGILLAALANTLSKLFLVKWLGTKEMVKLLAPPFLIFTILALIFIVFLF